MPLMTQIGALKLLNPKEWQKRIESAMSEAGGRVGDAAQSLDVSARQLFRWLALPELSHIERVPVGLGRDGKRGRRPKEIKSRKRSK